MMRNHLWLVAPALLAATGCGTTVDSQSGGSSSSSSSGGAQLYCDADRGLIKPPAHQFPFGFCKPGEICGIVGSAEYFSCCVEGPNCCKPPNPHVASCSSP